MTLTAQSSSIAANFILPVERGAASAVNGKPSFTVDEAAASILRDGYSVNGTGVTNTPAVVTYAFRATSGPMPDGIAGFSTFSSAQIVATEAVLAAWADVANVTFVRDGAGTSGAGAYSDNATMLFGNYASGNAGAAAFTYYPGDTAAGSPDGDIWVNNSLSYEANPTQYGYGYLTLAHEIGHGIGLEDAEYLDPGYGSPTYSVNAGYFENTQQYSVMSYWSETNTGANFLGLYASAPMMDDIAAAQALYGANLATRSGDTTYGFNSNAGRSWFEATSATSPVIFCVWDGSGTDTFDFSGYTQDALIDLGATHFSSVGGMDGNVSIAKGVTIENAIGGSGNDLFFGNAANNVINGGAGIDLVDYSGSTAALTVALGLAGSATGTGIGTDTLINIEAVTTGSGADSLTGNNSANLLKSGAGADTLSGLAGNDLLDGGLGDDTMFGGTGDDTYIVDSSLDVISEETIPGSDDGGVDTVRSSLTTTLGGNFENLTLTGTANLDGTGNDAANVIIGNAGSNRLNGGAGNDKIYDGDAFLGVINDTGSTFHGTLATAMAISPAAFSFNGDPDTQNATTVAHASVMGTGDGTYRVYAISINNAGAIGTFDIDQTLGMDSFLRLYNSSGTLLAFDDDSLVTDGAGGSASASDSYLTWTFTKAGTYYIEVSEYAHDAVGPGDTYELNISLANNGATAGGDDVIDGGVGADSMFGGLGNDSYYVDDLGDAVTESRLGGIDLVYASVSFVLAVNVENLILTGGPINGTGNDSANLLTANDSNNILIGMGGNDTFFAGGGSDTVDGGDGIDTADYSSDTAGLKAYLGNGPATGAGIGSDTLLSIENFNAGSGDDKVTGNDEANIINAGAGRDIFAGKGGNDRLDGGAGIDAMFGGSGDDTYFVDDAGDQTLEDSTKGVDDGGTDIVYASVSWVLRTFVENLTLTGRGSINGTGNAVDNLLVGNLADNVLSGGTGLDRLEGWGGNDTLLGGADADILLGGDGRDILDGGIGADAMRGGSGDDTYYIDNADDRLSEQAVAGVDDGGEDTVFSSVSLSLGAFVENLYLLGSANLVGAGNDQGNAVVGNGGNNLLYGRDGWDILIAKAGNDVLDGGSGNDRMYGGAGNDTYYVDSLDDYVADSSDGIDPGGIDVVFASSSCVLGDFIETLTLTGIGLTDGTGSNQANTINGNQSSNVLYGRNGNDQLFGNGGDDLLDGGRDADSMSGGKGNDTYVVDSWADVVMENVGEGSDTVMSSVSFILGANVENLTLTGALNTKGYGNALRNLIIGNNGNNLIDAGTGPDTMAGGLGDDTYVVETNGDIVTEAGLGGSDTVLSSISYTLAANVETLTLTGSAIAGAGNEIDNLLTGNALDNLLYGRAGSDILRGMDGNDRLDGGIGDDKMYGGAGNDTYIVDSNGDYVAETSGAVDPGGTDTVESSVAFSLGAFLENLTLTGSAAINGTGNGLDNSIKGNGAVNILNGGGGHDLLTGGGGADTFLFTVGSGADTILDFSVAQHDVINLHAYSAVAHNITQVGADTQIDFGAGNIVTIINMTATDPAFLAQIVW